MGRVETHEDLEGLLGVYALDALDGDEAELVGRHLTSCPRCREEVAQHREVAGLLGYVGQEAPAGVWERIAANLGEAPPAVRLDRVPGTGTGTVVPIQARRRRLPTRGVLAAVAAVAAAVIAVLGVQVNRLDHRTTSLGESIATPSMTAVDAAIHEPKSRDVVLRPLTGGQPVVEAVITADGSGYLYGSDLHPLPATQTYQLWGVVGDNRISYGVLGSDPGILPFEVSQGVKELAITEESAGGAVTSNHAPVALGSVPLAT